MRVLVESSRASSIASGYMYFFVMRLFTLASGIQEINPSVSFSQEMSFMPEKGISHYNPTLATPYCQTKQTHPEILKELINPDPDPGLDTNGVA